MSLTSFIDWFIPEPLRGNRKPAVAPAGSFSDILERPLLGLVLVAYLYAIEPSCGRRR
jgi:hypothetical protein